MPAVIGAEKAEVSPVRRLVAVAVTRSVAGRPAKLPGRAKVDCPEKSVRIVAVPKMVLPRAALPGEPAGVEKTSTAKLVSGSP